MSFKNVSTILSADVAASGTFTVGYPSLTDAGFFADTKGHKLWIGDHQKLYDYIEDFTLTFGASSITVTLGSSLTTAPAGSGVRVQLDMAGVDSFDKIHNDNLAKVAVGAVLLIELGAPDTADPNGICESQSITSAAGGDIDGALEEGATEIAVLDVPRALVASWTTTAVMTVTGTDEYGNVMVENSASGTTLTGKKAFKTVTAIAISTDVTSATVGTGQVVGLPIRLPGTGYVVAEIDDGAKATAGTIVAGVDTAATALTGDVRGTLNPNSTLDGAMNLKLLIWGADPTDKGVDQFAG